AKAIVIIVTQMNMEKSDTYAKALFASYIFTVVYFTFLAILFIIKGNEVSQSLYFTSFPLSTQPTTSSSRKPYTTGKKFCTNCGAEVDPKEPYCNSCGAKLI
ncbi:MAG: zinc ribbon domain-containing protein, partial [Candidatus Heimdallarchaeaceae archaeon]